MLSGRLVIGHRGAPRNAPENTLRSFEVAIDMGADMIELDVMKTSDDYLVCMHDLDVSRTTNGEGMVEELTLQQIKELDAGLGQKVPLLSEVFDLAGRRIGINVEIKVPDIEEQVVNLILERNMIDSVLVSSFDHSTLEVVKELNSSVFTGVLSNYEIEEFPSYAQQIGADAIHPFFEILTYEMVNSAHAAGLKVYPWTVNDESDMISYLNWGVDGIITDSPDVCIRLVDSMFNRSNIRI
ncbi:MAG: glycerophosphodiester phosphodiesterase [Candidatus Thorarchaeota archaeon]|jgi:glycerophosphoryl diester phosphodiesterase